MNIKPWFVRTAIIASLASASVFLAAANNLTLQPPPTANTAASKGPVQIGLRVYRTKIKALKSLWYQIELKDVGKESIEVSDRIFRDPWQLRRNCLTHSGIYLEVQQVRLADGTKAKPQPFKSYEVAFLRMDGNSEPHYDYFEGDDPKEGKKVNDKLNELENEWTKVGLSEVQKTLKRDAFWHDWNEEKVREENRAKTFPLAPGASTTTFAWAYPGDPHTLALVKYARAHGAAEAVKKKFDLHEDDLEHGVENQVGNYTQLWDYQFRKPGIYRIRAVYDEAAGEWEKSLRRRHGTSISSWRVVVKTPYIQFEVLP